MNKSSWIWGVVAAALSQGAQSTEFADGLEIGGYIRGGPTATQSSSQANGHYSLGMDGDMWRLGNEGDLDANIRIRKTFKLDGGPQWTVGFRPSYNNPTGGLSNAGVFAHREAYIETGGYDFMPTAKYWAGRRLFRDDVHVVDTFFIYMAGGRQESGAGVFDVPLGQGKLGIHVFRSDQEMEPTDNHENATRLTADLYDLPVNPGGKLRLIGAFYSGQFKDGTQGTALTIKHDQANFVLPGLTNSLWLQGSTGYGALNTGFGGPGSLNGDLNAASGTRAWRLIDSVMWQHGRFGGQAMAEIEYDRKELGGASSRGTSLGGRISYDLGQHVRLLSEGALTTRADSAGDLQRLNKLSVALALGLQPGFMSRPELRLYLTRLDWNAAAAAARSSLAGRSGTTLCGLQLESWW
jgi:maltoporin